MAYTVADLLEDKIVDRLDIITKNVNLDKPISAAVVHELPMEEFIKPKELVLSSAIGSEISDVKGEEVIWQIVEEAYNANASAVAFSLFPKKLITEEIIEHAEKLDLPILTFPWDLTFFDVQSNINNAVEEKRLSVYRKLQGDLFEAYFRSPDLEPAVKLISETLELPVALFNGQDYCLAKSEAFEEGKWTIQIGSMKHPYGSLKVQGKAPGGNRREMIQQYIAYPLSLWFNEMYVEESTKVRLQSDLAMTLATGNYDDYGEVIKQAQMLEVDLNLKYYVATMAIHSRSDMIEKRVLESVIDIMSIAREEGKQRKRAVISGSVGNQFTFFIEKPSNPANMEGEIEDPLINAIEEHIKKMFPTCWCLFGFSDAENEESDFEQQFNEAMLALHYCDRNQRKNQKMYYHRARILHIMSAVSAEDSVRKDAKKVLANLLDYDSGNGSMELMKTLSEFINSNYNTSLAARNLNIHRQSLLARLQKIEELTGMSLKNHEDLFVLEVYSRVFMAY